MTDMVVRVTVTGAMTIPPERLADYGGATNMNEAAMEILEGYFDNAYSEAEMITWLDEDSVRVSVYAEKRRPEVAE